MKKIKVNQYWRDEVMVKSHTRGHRRSKSVRKQHSRVKWNRVVSLLKWIFWITVVTYFLSTIEVSYKPFESKNAAEAKTELPLNGATSFESADIPRDVEARESRDYSLDKLIENESGGEAGRLNPTSYACGVGQAYPCTKMYPYATRTWIKNNKFMKDNKWYIPTEGYQVELAWMKNYIQQRYITSDNALYFWNVTSVKTNGKHWY